MNRIASSTRVLGDLGAGRSGVDVKTFTYQGTSATTTDTSVRGTSQSHTEEKNAIGKVVSVTDAIGTSLYTYDSDGNLTVVQEGAPSTSNVLTYVYDNRGRKTDMYDPDTGHWHYEYNGYGDVVLQKDGSGQLASSTYDALDRMTSRTDAGGTAEWIYDLAP